MQYCITSAAIWRRSLEANPNIPNPDGMGWTTQTSPDTASTELLIDWMDGQPASPVVLQLLACKCRRACELPSCVCMNSGLKCTNFCTLKDCTNQLAQDDPAVVIDNDADEELQTNSILFVFLSGGGGVIMS